MSLLSFWYATALAFFTAWTAAPIIVKYRNGSLDLFEPSIAFRGLLWLYSAPRCALYLVGVPSYLPFAQLRSGVSLTFEPLLLTIVGLSVFDLGYWIVARRGRTPFRYTEFESLKRPVYLVFGITLVLLSLLAHTYEIWQFGFGRFFARMHEFRDVGRIGSGPIQIVKETLGLGLGLIAISARSTGTVIFWLLAAVPAMVLSGSKFAVVLYLFPAVVFIRYAKPIQPWRNLSLRTVMSAVGAVLLLGASVGMMTLYRRNAALLATLDWTSPRAYAAVFHYSLLAFNRFHTFEVFGLTLESYKTLDLWAYGDWILDPFRQLIPRDIWHGKPLLMTTTTVTPLVRILDGGNHFYPPFIIGVFLFDFGIPGLVTLTFILGALMAKFHDAFILGRSGVYWRLVYSFGIYLLLGFVEGAAHPLAKLLYTALFVGVLYFLFLHVIPAAVTSRRVRSFRLVAVSSLDQ